MSDNSVIVERSNGITTPPHGRWTVHRDEAGEVRMLSVAWNYAGDSARARTHVYTPIPWWGLGAMGCMQTSDADANYFGVLLPMMPFARP